MPAVGRITLTAMLNDQGRIVGEFTVARPSEADVFHLFGSLPAEVHHSRWFRHHLPADGGVTFERGGPGRLVEFEPSGSTFKAARQWRFAPGMRLGEPVAVRVVLELSFTLR